MLMNDNGEVTRYVGRQPESTADSSHLMGFFYRTIRMVDHGIKPCYVFDGKPPELKAGVVSRLSLFEWLLTGS